jgi:Arc/MetJ-type ribon-helix-helix transcriptional regulator
MMGRITVRMSPEMLARRDAWIADQSGYVSRQEAVRRCVDLAFSRGGPTSVEASRAKQAEILPEDKPGDNEVVYLD